VCLVLFFKKVEKGKVVVLEIFASFFFFFFFSFGKKWRTRKWSDRIGQPEPVGETLCENPNAVIAIANLLQIIGEGQLMHVFTGFSMAICNPLPIGQSLTIVLGFK
jgi:hypothetical protein